VAVREADTMSIVDEARQALQPLIDQRLVHAVHAGQFAAFSGSDLGQPMVITVLVNVDDPESYRVDIMKLLLQAGLKVEVRLHPNPLRPRG
jgi:hypothetical protein